MILIIRNPYLCKFHRSNTQVFLMEQWTKGQAGTCCPVKNLHVWQEYLLKDKLAQISKNKSFNFPSQFTFFFFRIWMNSNHIYLALFSPIFILFLILSVIGFHLVQNVRAYFKFVVVGFNQDLLKSWLTQATLNDATIAAKVTTHTGMKQDHIITFLLCNWKTYIHNETLLLSVNYFFIASPQFTVNLLSLHFPRPLASKLLSFFKRNSGWWQA